MFVFQVEAYTALLTTCYASCYLGRPCLDSEAACSQPVVECGARPHILAVAASADVQLALT